MAVIRIKEASGDFVTNSAAQASTSDCHFGFHLHAPHAGVRLKQYQLGIPAILGTSSSSASQLALLEQKT